MGLQFRAAVVCLGLVLGLAAEARADGPEAQANQLYNEAKQLVMAGELEKAVEKLSEAWGLFQHPLIVKKRGEIREKLLLYEEAIADYQAFIGKVGRRKKKERTLLENRIQSLQALLQKPVRVSVVSSRPGMKISIDGENAKPAPFDLELTPGEHLAMVKDARFVPTERRFRVRAARPDVVRLDGTPRTGKYIIKAADGTFEGVEISLDQTPLALSPAERAAGETVPRPIPIGRHGVVCRSDGRPSFFADFEVRSGQVDTVECRLGAKSSGALGDPWGWITVGGALAGVAAGTGLLVSYAMDVETAEKNNQDLISTKHIFGGIALGVGVGLGIASYFVFTRDRGDRSASTTRALVIPTASALPGGGVAGAVVRF